MLFFNRIKKIINYIISIKNKRIKNPICRIEEFDFDDKIISLYCRGINSLIKLTLDEIINDSVMLTNLSSKQASWVGFYYGKHYQNLMNEKKYCFNVSNFTIDISSKPEKYNIIMLNRFGHLIYSNQNNGLARAVLPINAINTNIITQFSPMQACYIGVLAGIFASKNTARKSAMYLKTIK